MSRPQGQVPTEGTKSGKSKKKSNVQDSTGVRVAKFGGVAVVLVFCSIFAVHHVLQFMAPRIRAGGELASAGFYGQKIHVVCKGVDGDAAGQTVLVIQHDVFLTCLNYDGLQQSLMQRGIASCCVERPGFGYSPSPQHFPQGPQQRADLRAETALVAEAVLHVIGDEKNIVFLGHGVGALHALALTRMVPRVTSGLILISPLTRDAFTGCSDVSTFFKRPHPLASPVQQALQKSGLRRLLNSLLGPPRPSEWPMSRWIPSSPSSAAFSGAALQLALSDAAVEASVRSWQSVEGLVKQSQEVSSNMKVVVVTAADDEKSAQEAATWATCMNQRAAESITKLFKQSKVIKANYVGHFSIPEASDEIVEAFKTVTTK